MILQDIDIGTIADDGNGDNLREGAIKINANNALVAAALSGSVAGGALTGAEKMLGLDGSTNKAWLLSQVATYVTALISASAPATLDTLNELAAALGNDPSFATTIATALGGKQPLDSDLTAIAALSTATWGRALLTLADSAAARAVIEIDDRRVVVPANGGTTNVAASTAKEIILLLNHTATIASHTINLPAMLDGQKFTIRSRATITAATLNPNSGTILNNLSTYSTGGHAQWEWYAADSIFFRCD